MLHSQTSQHTKAISKEPSCPGSLQFDLMWGKLLHGDLSFGCFINKRRQIQIPSGCEAILSQAAVRSRNIFIKEPHDTIIPQFPAALPVWNAAPLMICKPQPECSPTFY